MAWRRPGDKPLSEAMLVSLPTHRASENNFGLQRKLWSPKYFFHSFIHFKILASAHHARRARFSDALLTHICVTRPHNSLIRHMLVYMCSSSLSYIHYFCNEERTCPLCPLMRERSYFVLKLSRNRRVHQYWSVWNQTFKASNNSSLITLIGHETMVCTVSMA